MAVSILRQIMGIKHFNTSVFRSITNNNRARFMMPTLRPISSLSQQFEEAKSKSSSLKEDPSNEVKLQMYALFKQSTQGKCNSKQPGLFDLVGRAKWSAWNSLGDMSQEDAQQEYVKIVSNLAAAESATNVSLTSSSSSSGQYQTLQVTQEGKIKTIILNRPDKKNAISLDMYQELKDVLRETSQDQETLVTVITGIGDFYCSGNDLSNFTELAGSGGWVPELAQKGGEILKEHVASFIDFPKILVALVNGPAVGIAVTVMGLFDLILASDKATFHTPFTSLGQSPEGISSYTFPNLMGSTKANEMLLFNRKLSACEAEKRGLVTEVYADNVFQKEAWDRIKYIASLPPESMLLSKKLTRGRLIKKFHEINEEECSLLINRWQSDECINAITSFMQRKSKL